MISREAIFNLVGEAQYVWAGENYSDLRWLDTVKVKPTQQALQTEITRLNGLVAADPDYFKKRDLKRAAKNLIEAELKDYALVGIDEFNFIRKWTRDFKIQVNLASSLADLKTRVATLPTLDDRNITQLKSAMDAK